MSRRLALFAALLSGTSVISAGGQQPAALNTQPAAITGIVTDVNGDPISNAEVVLEGPGSVENRRVVSNDNGSFVFDDLNTAVRYRVAIRADGFVPWKSPIFMVRPGQTLSLIESKLEIAEGAASVTVYSSSSQIAVDQVKIEERQRVFGIIPNLYVTYDHDAAPLTSKLKFHLALKASTDPVIFAAAALVAGADQAGGTPNYAYGAKGYGQRVGALYANGFVDIMIGEAVLPSLLHQDPRYFYQGTGTRRSRLMHALSSPFVCKGDNGRWEPNYSSVGGDLAAGAISNIYYPRSNRGAGMVFENAMITTGGRMANALVQEFILRRFTSNRRGQ